MQQHMMQQPMMQQHMMQQPMMQQHMMQQHMMQQPMMQQHMMQQPMMQQHMMQQPMMQQHMMQQPINNSAAQQILNSGYNGPVTDIMMQQMGMMQQPMMQQPMMQQPMMHQPMMQQPMNNPATQQILNSGYNGPVTDIMMQQMGIMGGGEKKDIKGQRRINRKKEDIFFLNRQPVMVGGEGVTVAPYDPRFMKNTPFKTREQKKIEESRHEYTKGPQPIIEFTVNDNILSKPTKPSTIYPSPYVPIGPSIQNMYAPNPYAQQNLFIPDNRYPYMFQPNKIPVINNYNIQLPGVMGDHAGLYKVFEDILPGDEYSNTYNTLDERIKILQNLRANLVRHNDGELIGLSGGGKNLRNLLSYIRMMELNPYHIEDDIGRNNPYRDLPSNMLLFRSCYPLQIDSKTNAISCSKNSIGMNVRVYELRVADFFSSELGLERKNLDVWRDIYNYEYIREEILKKKVSQNFVLLYSYYLSDAGKINFNKLRELRNLDNAPESKGITAIDDLKKEFESLVKTAVADPRNGINITLPTDKVLVALTESPNMPLMKWAMKQYSSNGPINKMIFTGFHSDNEWLSIIFQLVATLYTMEVYGICITNFKLRDNIFIKDLKTSGNIVGYWKYIIEDIPYYIPNYGYLLQIDSSYKDIPGITYTILDPDKDAKVLYKIYNKKIDNDDYSENLTFDNFMEAINPSNWGASFINKGGVKPPESIMILLQNMYIEAKTDLETSRNGANNFTINKYIKIYFQKYMHNRIGTLLRVNEITNLVKENPSLDECKPGKICIKEIKPDSQYQCIMITSIPDTNNDIEIYTKNTITDTAYKVEKISIGSIFKYSPFEHLEQNYKPDEAKLAESDMLDIYICKKH
jgi:hypothetical protein